MKSAAWKKALEENQETQAGSEGPHGYNRLRVDLDPEGDFMVSAKSVLSSKYIRIKMYVLFNPLKASTRITKAIASPLMGPTKRLYTLNQHIVINQSLLVSTI